MMLNVKIAENRRVSRSATTFWDDLKRQSNDIEKDMDARSTRDRPRHFARGGHTQSQLAAVRLVQTASEHQAGANDRKRRSAPEDMPESIREVVNQDEQDQPGPLQPSSK